ncbi:hypothetical protein N5C46_10210 [Rossellomorea vietnamensis]|uniref:Uncharacterized protein n=1 Tax=Rossellomorea vietnamensis TaxID=218284 RepID=A0ACD4CCZ8_9BACI|nr:hypothetical protein [Rossellomorea vietnamensis]UXH46388.1 hypothetical protein N5C46_10210 [Rossellomorea vietnamensis]
MKKILLSSLLSIGLLVNVSGFIQAKGTIAETNEFSLDVISPQFNDDFIEGNH